MRGWQEQHIHLEAQDAARQMAILHEWQEHMKKVATAEAKQSAELAELRHREEAALEAEQWQQFEILTEASEYGRKVQTLQLQQSQQADAQQILMLAAEQERE